MFNYSENGNENLVQALRYVSLGYKVYPVWGIKNGKCLCGGLKGCRPGKHPYGKAVPHGEKDATTEENIIRQWFKGSAVNIGVSIDGFVVLDFDEKHGGMKTLAEWERLHGPMPITPAVKSGGRGRHFYFKHPGVPLNEKPARGVDCLWGNGGGLIMPPSLHQSGDRYEWLVPPETPLAEMPPWLVEIIAEKPSAALSYAVAVRSTESVGHSTTANGFDPMSGVVDAVPIFDDLGMLPAGCRNAEVNRIVGSMLGNGFTPEQVYESGLRWAERQSPPYSTDDLLAKIRAFGSKQQVSITEMKYPQNAPLHEGEKHSPFAGSPFARGFG
jgi:hypothetical protein